MRWKTTVCERVQEWRRKTPWQQISSAAWVSFSEFDVAERAPSEAGDVLSGDEDADVGDLLSSPSSPRSLPVPGDAERVHGNLDVATDERWQGSLTTSGEGKFSLPGYHAFPPHVLERLRATLVVAFSTYTVIF